MCYGLPVVLSLISLWTTTCKEGTAFISKSFIFSAVQAVNFSSRFICSKPWKFSLPVLLKLAFLFFYNLSLQEPSLPFCYDLLGIHLILLKENPTTKTFFFGLCFLPLSTRILSLGISYFLTGLVTKARFLSQMELVKNKWLKWLWNGKVVKEYLTLFWQAWGLLVWL